MSVGPLQVVPSGHSKLPIGASVEVLGIGVVDTADGALLVEFWYDDGYPDVEPAPAGGAVVEEDEGPALALGSVQ